MRERNPARSQNLARLRNEPFDVLVIGGGINGAGIARDLVLRDPGIRVALASSADKEELGMYKKIVGMEDLVEDMGLPGAALPSSRSTAPSSMPSAMVEVPWALM